MSADRDYRDLIAEVIGGGEVDPRVIADKVEPRLTDDQRAELMMAGLVRAARHQLREVRQPNPSQMAQQLNGKRGLGEMTHQPKRWAYSIDGTAGGWRSLAECTVDDLRRISSGYMARARWNAAAAERLTALADALVATGVATVGDLPDDVVEELMCT